MTTTHDEDMYQLETLIDRRTLHTVLSMLSEICSLKEQHLVENWRADSIAKAWWRADSIAKAWRTYELKLDKLAINCPI